MGKQNWDDIERELLEMMQGPEWDDRRPAMCAEHTAKYWSKMRQEIQWMLDSKNCVFCTLMDQKVVDEDQK